MNHLSPAEFADAAERVLPADRAAHLNACARCREQAAAVAAALSDASTVDVPEPSPLYWSHLSERVRERIAGETIVPAWRASLAETFRIRHLVPIASAVALVGAVFASGLMTRNGRLPAVPEPLPVVTATNVEGTAQGDDSEAWQLLTSAAAETAIEDAHAAGMGVPAGAIDGAVQRMSPDELNALGRLLQDELRRSGD